LVNCSGQCKDTHYDPLACGSCSSPCPAGYSCFNSACKP
jgi:hypothetical protein